MPGDSTGPPRRTQAVSSGSERPARRSAASARSPLRATVSAQRADQKKKIAKRPGKHEQPAPGAAHAHPVAADRRGVQRRQPGPGFRSAPLGIDSPTHAESSRKSLSDKGTVKRSHWPRMRDELSAAEWDLLLCSAGSLSALLCERARQAGRKALDIGAFGQTLLGRSAETGARCELAAGV